VPGVKFEILVDTYMVVRRLAVRSIPRRPRRAGVAIPGTSIAAVRRMDRMPSTNSVMTPFPHVVEVDDSLRHARALMVRHQVRHLPVKEGSALVGVLTDRDLKRALDPDLGLPPKDELFVRDVFEPEAYVVDSSEPLDHVLEHMAAEHIGSALVRLCQIRRLICCSSWMRLK
jgi:CBS domain-containing protein